METVSYVIEPEPISYVVGESMRILHKDEDATKKIVFDWSKWLGASTISSVAWESDSGITLSGAASTSTTATNYVSSGTEDCEYWLKCKITTADSPARIEARSVLVRVVRT